MTIDEARLTVQESVARLAIFAPDEARTLQLAIWILIGEALNRHHHHPEDWPAKDQPERRRGGEA